MSDRPTPETDAAKQSRNEWEQRQVDWEMGGGRDILPNRPPDGWEMSETLERQRDELREALDRALTVLEKFDPWQEWLQQEMSETLKLWALLANAGKGEG